jgi:ribosomal protein S18 acetylase RimI-like enzyme
MVSRSPTGSLRALISEDWASVNALVAACGEGSSLELPLDRTPPSKVGEINQLLYHEADQLLGIATLSPGAEVEVLGMVHPAYRRRGIGRALVAGVVSECRKRDVAEFLLVCEEASIDGCAFAVAIGARYRFAEYLMQLNWSSLKVSSAPGGFDFRAATADDIEQLIAIRSEVKGPRARQDLERWLNRGAQIVIARSDGRAVAMIRVSEVGDTVWLASFAVLAAQQGRGVGRFLLGAVLENLGREKKVLLEVETDNDHAIALYRSTGFIEQTTYRYYRQRIE